MFIYNLYAWEAVRQYKRTVSEQEANIPVCSSTSRNS